MPLIILALLIAALVFAILAALNRPSRFDMIGSALACYFLSIILPLLRTLLLITVCFVLFAGCSTQSIVSSQLANDAVAAVARHYGGAEAGALASAGLSATADVMQGYVDKKPPLQVAANSPGVQGVSQIVVNYLKTKGWVTQETVDNLHSAAQIAERATVSTVNEGP